MTGRTPNRSAPVKIKITVPAQTYAYLVKLATVGALGQHEALIAGQLVVNEVERLIETGRAEKTLPTPPPRQDDGDADDVEP